MIARLPGPQSEPISIRWSHLGFLLLFALGLRAVSLASTDVIGADSSRFLAQAVCFENGDHESALADPYHPLTAILIAGVNSAQNAILPPVDLQSTEGFCLDQRRRERAGWLVSLAAGLLFVWLSFDLTARLFPRIPPISVALLTAVQPYFVRASIDIMSDMIFLTIFALALRSGLVAMSGSRWLPFLATGLFSGLAYLTRPEGILLVPGIGAVWALCRPWGGKVAMPRALATLAVAALCIVPYTAAIGGLTAKKDVGEFVAGPAIAPSSAPATVVADPPSTLELALASFREIFHEWLGTAPETISGVALIGVLLLLRKGRGELGPLLYLAIAATLGAVLLRLLIMVGEPGYISRRHVYLLVFLALPFTVAGIAGIAHVIAKLLPAGGKRFAFPVLLALFVASLIPKAIDDHRAGQRAQRFAAEYILEHGGPGQRVYASREKVWYYCGGRFTPIPSDWAKERLEQMAGEERAWLAFYRERFGERVPELEALLTELGSGLTLEASWQEAGRREPRHLDLYLYQPGR